MALTKVVSDGIATGAVTSDQIAAGAVTTADLEDSGVTAGTYGSSSAIPAITVDAKGRVTSASTNAISVESDRIFEGNTYAEVVDTGSDGHFKVVTEGTDALRVDSSQRVGIGETSPLDPLQVTGASGIQISLNTPSGGRYTQLAFRNNDTQKGAIWWDNSANFLANFAVSGGQHVWYIDTEEMRLDASGNLRFNSGYGSVATAYGVRAWVNFNGTGTVAIRESGNVSSITDNGTGQYQVNFTNSMPDDSYSVAGTATWSTNTWGATVLLNGETGAINSGYVRVVTVNNATSAYVDSVVTNVLIIR